MGSQAVDIFYEARSRVLVVDDDPSTVAATEMLLEMEGFDVSSATTASEAESIIKTFNPRFVLTDINLPDKSGVELANIIRAEYGDSIIGIALSGTAKQDMSQQDSNAFTNQFLKPVDIDNVVAFLNLGSDYNRN